jgi:8-oxo-dGTP diphosphatase
VKITVFPVSGEPEALQFAVIAAKHKGKWVWVRHRDRDTFEMPGGHIEAGETALDAARRELFEESGATEFTISEICANGVDRDGEKTYGKLFYAEITAFVDIPSDYEMAERALFDVPPGNQTYPEIQAGLLEMLAERGIT